MNVLMQHAAKLTRCAETLSATDLKMAEEVAAVVEASITRVIGQDAPRRRVAGGRVGVTHKVLSVEPAKIEVKASGPLHLLANKTDPHLIIPTGGRGRQGRAMRLASYQGKIGSGVKPLRTPYGPRYAVNHPGTKGKNTWHRGVDEARPLIPGAMQRSVAATLAKALR